VQPAPSSPAKSDEAHRSGITQHFFTSATVPLKLAKGNKLFAYCYLDPANPPMTVMLQWNDGQWNTSVLGDDKISFGAGDVPDIGRLGDLPKLASGCVWKSMRLTLACQPASS